MNHVHAFLTVFNSGASRISVLEKTLGYQFRLKSGCGCGHSGRERVRVLEHASLDVDRIGVAGRKRSGWRQIQ